MSISQARMIALINAALDAHSKINELVNAIHSVFTADDINDALRHLEYVSSAYVPSMTNIQLVAAEAAHFKRHLHKNNRNAARLRRLRGTPEPGDHEFTAMIKSIPARAKGALANANRTPDTTPIGARKAYNLSSFVIDDDDDVSQPLPQSEPFISPRAPEPPAAPIVITDECGQSYGPGGEDIGEEEDRLTFGED